MKNIRIGNDIQVRATLHELGEWGSINIKSVCCYFVRIVDTTDKSKYPQYYEPTQYSMNCCGNQPYNIWPSNVSINDPHWFPGYNGFGVYSTPFEHTPNEFQAPVKLLQDKGRVEAFFPAQEQRYAGTYKVIFVVSLYEYGWNVNNIRTYTIDKGEVFILSSDGEDTSCIIDVDEINDHTVTIFGNNIDSDKTTIPVSVEDAGSINGRIYLKVGYVVSGGIITINGVVQDYDFILGKQYVDVSLSNITGDVIINIQTQHVGVSNVTLSGSNINEDLTTIPSSTSKGNDITGKIYVKDGYVISLVTVVYDGVTQSIPFTLGKQYVDISLKAVSADQIIINIQSKDETAS